MPKSILQQLFDGEIYPAENVCKDNLEYTKILRTLSDEKERFLKNLSDEDCKHFQNVEDIHYEAAGMYSYECFAHGFRLGIALILEALNVNDNHIQNDE